jgi:hypothetical protein
MKISTSIQVALLKQDLYKGVFGNAVQIMFL